MLFRDVPWEPEGRYHCIQSLWRFWFSSEHHWTSLTPFCLSPDDIQVPIPETNGANKSGPFAFVTRAQSPQLDGGGGTCRTHETPSLQGALNIHRWPVLIFAQAAHHNLEASWFVCQSHIRCLLLFSSLTLFLLLALFFAQSLPSKVPNIWSSFITNHVLSSAPTIQSLFLSHFNFSSPSYSFSFLRIVLLPCCHFHFLVCSFVLCLSFIPPVPSVSLAFVLLFICLVLSWCFVCYPVLTYKHFLTMLLNRCSHFKLLLSELSPPIILLQIC